MTLKKYSKVFNHRLSHEWSLLSPSEVSTELHVRCLPTLSQVLSKPSKLSHDHSMPSDHQLKRHIELQIGNRHSIIIIITDHSQCKWNTSPMLFESSHWWILVELVDTEHCFDRSIEVCHIVRRVVEGTGSSLWNSFGHNPPVNGWVLEQHLFYSVDTPLMGGNLRE